MVSPANTPAPNLLSRGFLRLGSFPALRFLLLALAFTLVAIAAEQFAAPILHSSSPLWATTAWLLLVWRRGKIPLSREDPRFESSISIWRLAGFLAAHGVLIFSARRLGSTFQVASGAMTVGGMFVAASKLCVLVPTMLLFPLAAWRKISAIYFPEAIAGLVAMLLGNAIRITSFVVLGNHGFAEVVSRFHISAGWIFFSVVFLDYLSLTYSWMLGKRSTARHHRG